MSNKIIYYFSPGVTITELQKRGGLSDEAYEAFLKRSKETHALGRPGDPEEVAKAIAFLASEDASFSTGVSLPVDGGVRSNIIFTIFIMRTYIFKNNTFFAETCYVSKINSVLMQKIFLKWMKNNNKIIS